MLILDNRPLHTVFDELYQDADSSGKAAGRDEKVLTFALFTAVTICCSGRRSSTTRSPNHQTYLKPAGYEKYPATVSGPCYELLMLMADIFSIESIKDFGGQKLTADRFHELACDITQKVLRQYDRGLDFPALLKKNASYLADYLQKTAGKAAGSGLPVRRIRKELLKDCYLDLGTRIERYNDVEREKKRTDNIHNDDDVTDISFTLAPNRCRKVLEDLDKSYMEVAEDKTDTPVREKLENILLPVYSDSPYFALCIAHKKQLPEPVRNRIRARCNFVFVITAVTYEMNGSSSGAAEYLQTQNVISYAYLSTVEDESWKYEQAKDTPMELDTKFYISGDSCCVTSYDRMKEMYRKCCLYFRDCLSRTSDGQRWFPIDLPRSQFTLCSSLFAGTPAQPLFTFRSDITSPCAVKAASDYDARFKTSSGFRKKSN